MNKELMKKTEEWMKLERKTLEQRREADLYYDTNLMKLIEQDFIERNGDAVPEKVHYLVVSVGTSYEPIVLNISLLSPDKILFLYTEKSGVTLDKVVDYTGIKPSAYEKRLVNEIDPIDIYREIKDAYLLWNRPEKMYIDFTGGTKAMSAAAALAGSMVNVRMVYVASDDYLVDFRKPNPGSERLVYIDNPLEVFGDLEIEKAHELYAQRDFAGAADRLALIRESIPNPVTRQELEFVYTLSRAYEGWDALDFTSASKYMDDLVRQVNRDGRGFKGNPVVGAASVIHKQAGYLSALGSIPGLTKEKKQQQILEDKDLIIPLMFTMKMNAVTRESQHKYDMATLLMYRLLEMIEQRRLSRYHLYVSDMKYDQMAYNRKRTPELAKMSEKDRAEWLRSEVASIRHDLFGAKVSEYLPNPVSLLDGFVILSALHDPIVYDDDKTRLNVLKQIRSKVYLRNNSIFAHGLGPVDETDYRKFADFVTKFFEKLCRIEKTDYAGYSQVFEWIPIEAGRED
ncbi:MAG: TIGR02710 family CRISPR-associated protein [Lachnospiraceae bacterium]|nr:TIGR02710 family CRISPR-associated protein [Lachnospiraceae bacterium]